jgi:hypothetical protein
VDLNDKAQLVDVGMQWEDPGLIINIPTKPLDTMGKPFQHHLQASEVSPEASRGATRTKVLQ